MAIDTTEAKQIRCTLKKWYTKLNIKVKEFLEIEYHSPIQMMKRTKRKQQRPSRMMRLTKRLMRTTKKRMKKTMLERATMRKTKRWRG